MDYKDKYEKAVQAAMLAKQDTESAVTIGILEEIFPELRESGDEMIRKGIIRNLEYLMDRAEGFVKDELKERIAWLEKQGNNMGISEATKKKLEDNLNRALEKETPESFNEFLDEQCEQKPVEPQQDMLSQEKYANAVDECIYGERKPAEWSEEDLYMIENALFGTYAGDIATRLLNKIKSLKERYTWKPTNEQMHYLSWIANIKLGDSVVEQEVSKHLNELYEQLKQL